MSNARAPLSNARAPLSSAHASLSSAPPPACPATRAAIVAAVQAALGCPDAVPRAIVERPLSEARAVAGCRVWHLAIHADTRRGLRRVDLVYKRDVSAGELWSQEPAAYRSGALAGLRGGLRAPRCVAVDALSGAESGLWLEYVPGAPGATFSDDRLRVAARHLGEMNGAFVASGAEPPSFGPPGAPSFLDAWLASRAAAADWILDPSAWRQPDVGLLLPSSLAPRLAALWNDRAALTAELAARPRALAHLDAHVGNLLDEGNGRRTVAIDWSHAGPAALGEELSQLVTAPLLLHGDARETARLEAVALGGYLGGLRAAKAPFEEGEVLRALALHAALHWAFGVGFVLRHASTVEGRRRYEARMGRPFRALLREAADRTAFLLDRVESTEPTARSLPGRQA